MIIGIIGAWIFIKERVYICPAGATCPGSFNPDNSFLQDIRTVMQYWLHVGMLIFGVGLVRLVAYQAWSAMQQRGNTIDILDLNVGVVNGSAFAAANLLLLRKRNRSLGVFVLAHVAIISAISLVVGKSITTVTDTGSVELLFDYPMNISILNVGTNHANNLAPGTIEFGTIKYGPTWAWLNKGATNVTSLSNETISGTFIIQDSRAEYGVNAQPSGQQISGSVSCVDPSDSIIVNMTNYSNTGALNITCLPDIANNISGTSTGSLTLELNPYNFVTGKLTGQYLFTPNVDSVQNATFLWFATSDGIIPNAIEVPLPSPPTAFSSDMQNMSSLFIGLCKHTVTFPNIPQNNVSDWESGDGVQYINPSQPAVYLPPGEEFGVYPSSQHLEISLTPENPVGICDDGCMWAAVWDTLLTWWGLQTILPQTVLEMDIFCNGGVLAPAGGDTNQTCPSLDGEIWNRTLALVLDAMIQTYPKVGNTSQTLFAQADSIGMWQWWLQGIIPFSAFMLYVACLMYTVTAYWTGEAMKELDLLEVVNATRAEEEVFTKSVMVGGKLKELVGRRRE